jgi:peptidoglycan hydrolase-like protein with peptidoglycan-binding domain
VRAFIALLVVTVVACSAALAAELDPQLVRHIQQRLADMGYDPGPVDGRYGEKTRKAVKQLQRDREHAATGELDLATLAYIDPDLHAFAAVTHTSAKARAAPPAR